VPPVRDHLHPPTVLPAAAPPQEVTAEAVVPRQGITAAEVLRQEVAVAALQEAAEDVNLFRSNHLL